MSPRLFWKLFLIYSALQLATVFAFVVLVSNWQEQQTFSQKERRLQDAAAILRGQVDFDFQSGNRIRHQQLVDMIASETNMRVTIIKWDGVVLADSEKPASKMENHKQREELRQAAAEGTGSSKRFSTTTQMPTLYYAVRVEDTDQQPVGWIRVAVPLAEVEAEVTLVERMLWLVALGVSLGGLLLNYLVIGRALKPVGTLTYAANAMAAGEYQERVVVGSRDELGALAQSFNRMGSEIEAREGQLREVVDRMSAVLGGMIEGVFAVDDEQRILFANEAAGRLLGFRPETVQGQHLFEVIENETLQQIAKDTICEPGGKLIRQIEIENGPVEIVLAVNGAKLPGEPCPGIVVVLHDVSELRRLEKLRQEFVANVSHELKTPLSAIIAYAETLRHGAMKDPEHGVRFVKRIEEQASRLAELIQDMLQLARIEASQVPYEISMIEIGQVVETCFAANESAAEQKSISLVSQEELRHACIPADEEALRQILDNLVTNAIKYTPEGGRVEVDWRIEDAELVIQVRDNGIGIPEKHHSRIFERFYRVDKARSRELGGTGLGLAIVKHLAQMLGGAVALESAPGKGSTFQVRLPLAETPEILVNAEA